MGNNSGDKASNNFYRIGVAITQVDILNIMNLAYLPFFHSAMRDPLCN
jgi:hypothetical protein